MKNVCKAFVAAQREFAPALKTATNPHFRNKYAPLEACIDAILPALHANGLALMQRNHPSETGVIVETVFVHESGEELSGGPFYIAAAKQEPQAYMAAQTYCRRGSLMTAAGQPAEDDDGNAANAATQKHNTPPANKTLTTKDRESFAKSLKAATTVEDLKTRFTTAYNIAHAADDPDSLAEFIAIKDARKAELDAFAPENKRVAV